MEISDNINNIIISKLVENSSFTPRQIHIIYKFMNKEERVKEISSGAYYRELKQSKVKLRRIFYSIVLLDILGITDKEQIMILNTIVNNLRTLNNTHDEYHGNEINRVMNVIEELINKMINR